MSVWVLLQIVLNVLLLLGVSIIWFRLKRPPKDDPRLSRGLQLLQSKITVLEDLSDRTDRQVSQLTSLLDQKTRLLQSKIFDAEAQIQKVQGSMDRSMEVAEIFQDKIPHDEIIERQNTVKYIQAARLAHSGASVEEIIDEVDLPREQVEFIAKVNKDKLMFDENKLPAWANKKSGEPQMDFELNEMEFETQEQAPVQAEEEVPVNQYNIDPSAFDLPQEKYDSLKRLGDEFRQVCETFESPDEPGPTNETGATQGEAPSQIYQAAKSATKKIVDGVSELIHEPFHKEESGASANVAAEVATQPAAPEAAKKDEATKPQIQKVVFPRIDLDDTLG